MLSEINVVGGWFQNEVESAWSFDEITFNEEDVKNLVKLPLSIDFFKHSARINVSKSKNHCYIPSHYFLYAIKIEPLISLLLKYRDVFEQVKGSLDSAQDFYNLIHGPSKRNEVLDQLDLYSRDNFIKAFCSSEHRLKGKSIINGEDKKKEEIEEQHNEKSGKKTSSRSYRSIDSFISSIILKALPVPDASSEILGELLCALAKSPKTYQYIIERYSKNISYLFKCETSEELMYRLFSLLGWKGKLDPIFDSIEINESIINFYEINEAFRLSDTKVQGNIYYYDEPVHYSQTLRKYIHIRKDILNDDNHLEIINNALEHLYPGLIVERDNLGFSLKFKEKKCLSIPRKTGGYNKILYGSPGTGKSRLLEDSLDKNHVIRTVFHPETQYTDFIGCLKPVMEEKQVAYKFRPGVFTTAIVKAIKDPKNHYYLVLEEINRAPAAAVFGETFQLLDRDQDGSSFYEIDISDPDLFLYLNENTNNHFSDGKLSIPSNLCLIATMNNSDQAVMPLDTAFKRRWSFEYVGLSFEKASSQALILQTSEGQFKISWSDFANKVINKMLKSFRVPEDRMIGPFFLNENELKNWDSALRGKLFVYLWDDVLRHKTQERSRLFSSKFGTFGELYNSFPQKQVFGQEADELIKQYGIAVERIDE